MHVPRRRLGHLGVTFAAALSLVTAGAVSATAAPGGAEHLGDASTLGVVAAPDDVTVVPGRYLVDLDVRTTTKGGSARSVQAAAKTGAWATRTLTCPQRQAPVHGSFQSPMAEPSLRRR